MWAKLERLIKKEDKAAEISKQLHIEFELFANLRETYERKLRIFNELLLEYGTDKNARKWNDLKNIFSTTILEKSEKLEETKTRIENQAQGELKKDLTENQRTILTDLLAFLESKEFKEYKRILFLQRQMIFSDKFLQNLGEFKNLLDQEGKLLNYELDILTQIEDKLRNFPGMSDPYQKFDANTIVSVLKQLIMQYGIHNFQIKPTGSTARGTAVKTSDYDIVMLFDEKVQEALISTPDFGIFLNKNIPAYLSSLPNVEKIKFDEDKFHLQTYIGVRELQGKIHFSDKTTAEIHLMALKDEEEFREIISFAESHAEWIKQVNRRKQERFNREVPLLKDYLRAVGLYPTKAKPFTGTMMETVLRTTTLKRMMEKLSSALPWTNKSAQIVEDLLLTALTPEQVNRIKNTGYAWETPEQRLKRVALAGYLYATKRIPEINERDIQELYPEQGIIRTRIIGKSYIEDFIKLIQQTLTGIKETFLVINDQKIEIYFITKGQGTKTYGAIIALSSLPKISGKPKELEQAALQSIKERKEEYKTGIVDFIQWLVKNL